jgi:metal-responsive CopG/Arc/MetJ family transcriptional regulator
MKTAISLDGELLKEADQTARALGLSRSRLFSLALENYLRHRRQEQLLDQLNQAYSNEPDPTEAPNLKAKFRSTIKDRW